MKKLLLFGLTLLFGLNLYAEDYLTLEASTENSWEHQYRMHPRNENGAYWLTAGLHAGSEANAGKFAFVAAEGENNYYVYSVNDAKWLTYTDATNGANKITLSEEKGAYFTVEFGASTSGNAFGSKKGYTFKASNATEYMNFYQGPTSNNYQTTGTIGFWQQNWQDAGSVWVLEAPEVVEVTYNITATNNGNDPLSLSVKKSVAKGETADVSSLAIGYFSDFQITEENKTVTEDNKVFTVTASHNMPMVPGKFYNVQCVGKQFLNRVSDTEVNITAENDSENDAYLWYVVSKGDGSFWFCNKANEKAVIGKGNNATAVAFGEASGETMAYEFVVGSNGFRLFEPGTGWNLGAHGNSGGKANCGLGRWQTGRNSGAEFVATEVTIDEPEPEFTLTVAAKGENTYTVTPSDETSTWYACVVPASTFDGLEDEEDKAGAAWSALVEAVAELTASDLYTGAKDINVAELYAEQNSQELTNGDYILVVGGVATDVVTIPTDVIEYTQFSYTTGGSEEGETVPTYTISTPRGDLFTDGNGLLLTTRSLTLAGSRTETNDKWVIIEAKDSEHGVYIYNVEHNTFIGNNNRGTNGVTAPMVAEPNMFYRWATGSTNETVKNNAYNDLQYKETDYPWSLGEEDGLVGGKYYTINVCNWDDKDGNHTGLRLCSTSGYDDGNIFNIEENGTITKEAYDAIYAKIYGAATEAEVTAAEQLLALTGVGYPTATAEARVALAALLEQEEIGKTELAEAVAAFQASTEIEMPKVGKYYVDAQFVDGSSARMTAKNDVLTFTKVESELEAAYVNVVSVEGNTVVMTIGDKYVHVTCGADAASKEADVDGLTETQGDNTNLTLEVGGAAQFGRFLIQGLTSSNARYYLTTRDDLDGTFAFVANTPTEKFYDTNWNSNGHFRTSYYTFTAVEEEGPTGDEFTFVNNGDGTVTITPANTTNYWYVNVVAQSDIESYGETESEQNGSAVYEAIAEFYSQTEGYQGEQSINVSELYKQVKGEDMTDGSYVITVAYLTEEEIVEGISMVVPDFDSTTARFDYTYGSTTGIANVASAMSSNAIFNLQGQRIVKLQKGINIVGGQKVIK